MRNSCPKPKTRIEFDTLLFHPHGELEADPSGCVILASGKPWQHGMEITGGVCVDGSLLIAVDEGQPSFYGTTEAFRKSFGFRPRSDGKGVSKR